MNGCILQLILNTIYETTIQQICTLYTTMKHMQKDEFEFGLTIPQGWRGGDLPLEEENNPVKQYEFSKLISVTADSIGFDSIYAYDHLIPFSKVKSTNCQARNMSVIRQQTNLKRWKRSVSYGYRWIAETAFSSIKRTFGEHVTARKFPHMVKEIFLKAALYNMFNRMT
jgi:Transposase DDE domain